MKIKNGEFLQGDCLELMKDIPDGSVSFILTDLPYGTTSVDFDKAIIPFEPLWEQYWRVLKPNGAVALTSAQPFTTELINSQRENFRYTWYWKKSIVTGFQNAKLQPLRCFEDVCVFYRERPTYNPQGVQYNPQVKKNGKTVGGETVQGSAGTGNGKGKLRTAGATYIQEYTNYPSQLLEFESNHGGFHPTQKPVALFEYLIKTYTDEGETVLDSTAGSGTTAIAAENTGRKWICMEMDKKYYDESVKRVEEHGKSSFDEALFA